MDPEPQAPLFLSQELIDAVTQNDVARLKLLQEAGECVGAVDGDGNTLLHLAIQTQIDNSTIDAFIYLLKLDEISKNAKNSIGRSPLMETFNCVEDSRDYAIELIKSGCELPRFPGGNTALHLAVSKQWTEVAELLIETGFNLDCQNDNGETPLHVACRTNSEDKIDVWMLLFYGADPNLTYTRSQVSNKYPSCTMNYFDVILKECSENEMDDFLNLKDYDTSFGLVTFMEGLTLQYSRKLFQKLIKITVSVHYTYDDLNVFSQHLSAFDPESFALFIREFSYVVGDMIQQFRDVLICDNFCDTKVLSENIFILMESDVESIIVDEINSRNLLTNMIESFSLKKKPDFESLGQLLFCMFSYGVNVTAENLNAIYFYYGYCDLFKMMLHMDIMEIDRLSLIYKRLIPRIIYDMNMKIDYIVSQSNYHQPTVHILSKYFTLLKISNKFGEYPVPSLTELARNCSRVCIIEKLNVENSRQFYTLLKKIPIPEVCRKIISFEKRLY